MAEERRNLYRILHVQPEAPPEVIRASYRTLMSTLRVHPDLGGDNEAAARINEAYAVLSDPVRRAAYDRQLRESRVAVPNAAGHPVPASAAARQAADPGTWQADRQCPFCRLALPRGLQVDSRCSRCGSPLFRRPEYERSELLGRRRSPRSARPMAVTLRLPGQAQDLQGELRDVSLTGLGVAAPLPVPVRSPLRVITPGFDAVAVVVGCQPLPQARWLVHAELLTLQLLRQQGVFVSARA